MVAQEFKICLLLKLAEAGLTPREFLRRFEKAAMDPVDVLGRLAAGAGSTGQGVLSTGLNAGLSGLSTLGHAAIIAPAALGAAAGIATEKLESPDPSVVDTAQKAELIGLYRRLAREIRNRKGPQNRERVV